MAEIILGIVFLILAIAGLFMAFVFLVASQFRLQGARKAEYSMVWMALIWTIFCGTVAGLLFAA